MLGTLDLEDAAKKASGNWQHFDSFIWFRDSELEDADQWAVIYTSNRDSGLLDQSNSAVIAKAMEQFTEGKTTLGMHVWLRDVVVTQDRSPIGAGYMSLDKGEMQWTLTYDEVDIVLEGELVITRGNEQVRGKTGDVIYIPKGSSITFGTPNWTRFVYVVFPVNWNEK